MVTKTYSYFTSIWNLSDTKTVTIDYFSTVSSAKLIWNTSGGSFNEIRFNDRVISTSSKGQATVDVKNGQSNKLQIKAVLLTSIQASLEVTGYLATYEIVLAQNQNAAAGYVAGKVGKADFSKWCDFQNNVARAMLQNGAITSVQYQTLVNILTDALKEPDKPTPPTNGGNNNNGGDGNWWNGLPDLGGDVDVGGVAVPKMALVALVVLLLIGGGLVVVFKKRGVI